MCHPWFHRGEREKRRYFKCHRSFFFSPHLVTFERGRGRERKKGGEKISREGERKRDANCVSSGFDASGRRGGKKLSIEASLL